MLDIYDRVCDIFFNKSWYDGSHTSDDNPIIIGGCARSGTTLMRVMLDSHPNIYCGPESLLFRPIRIKTKRRMRWLSWKFDVPYEQIKNQVVSSSCLAEFIEKYFKTLAASFGKPRWGEKTPTNVRRIGYIFKHFPNARFIHMIRDGRDTSCSLKHFPKRKIVNGKVIPVETNNPLERCIDRWVNDIRQGRDYLDDPRYMEVKYEELVIQQSDTVRNILKFINEPWDDKIQNYYNIESPSRDISKFPQNIEATQPPYTRSIGRWRDEFSEKDIVLFKELAGDLLVELGYEENNDW